MNKLHPVLTLTLALGLLTGLTTGATVSAALRQDFGEPLVLWHLVLYGLSTGPRDKGLRTPLWGGSSAPLRQHLRRRATRGD